jgi:hypothetical protein
VILDYHGKTIVGKTHEEYMAEEETGAKEEYVMEISRKYLIDGTQETCTCHPDRLLLGRLANYANQKKTTKCNMKLQRHIMRGHTEGGNMSKALILFVARRDIEPLEELRFDYGDRRCAEMFGDN